MTPWVKRIIIANVVAFLFQLIFPWVTLLFAFVPAAVLLRPWTVISYMFLHGGIIHILFNMWIFYIFGPRLEMRLGGRNFLTLYFVSGISGALLSAVTTPHAAIIGASGAVFGIELAYAMFWPRDKIYIWGVLPVEVRWLVVFLTGMSLFAGFSGSGDGVAHFAHLGGFAGAFLYLKWLDYRSPARRFKRKAAAVQAKPNSSGVSDLERWRGIRRDDMHSVNRDELDRILDKISAEGMNNLTPDERAFLERFASREQS
jgi:membrane associated rhomboid family serine protease